GARSAIAPLRPPTPANEIASAGAKIPAFKEFDDSRSVIPLRSNAGAMTEPGETFPSQEGGSHAATSAYPRPWNNARGFRGCSSCSTNRRSAGRHVGAQYREIEVQPRSRAQERNANLRRRRRRH